MRVITTFLLLLSVLTGFGQSGNCGFEHFRLSREREWQYKQIVALLLAHAHDVHLSGRSMRYFPVVIHVVARPGYQMISTAQALHQLDVLNNDFAGTGENVYKLADEFKPVLGSSAIQFCLATADPAGAPTSGITYTLTDQTDIAFRYEQGRRILHYDQLGGKSGWDPTRYINIWVCEYGNILGSASFPGMAFFEEETGLIIDIEHFGSIGNAGGISRYGRGHTLTHEMGHFFGLHHIWGDGDVEDCLDGDDIDDTPNAAGPHFGCPSGRQSSCGTSNMFQNFMDLTDDYCLSIFTQDQVSRMEAAADLFYAEMFTENPCTIRESVFDVWYDRLQWSADPGSDKYVLFHPEGFGSDIRFDVFSADGKLIFQRTWSDDLTALIDLSRAGPGIYFVYIASDSGHRCKKIVNY